MATIVFASDSHLNKHYARMTPDQLAERRQHLRAGLAQTVDYALAERADVYIHGGDLFDGPNPRAVELMWTAGQLKRLADAGIQTLLIGGNHDIPKSREAGATPQRLYEVVRLAHVFTRDTAVDWWTADIGGVRVAIGGLPPDPRLPLDADPLTLLVEPLAPPEADARILITHYAVEGRLHPLAEEPTIRTESIAALAGVVDCVLVGHVHDAVDAEVAGVKVVFPGPTERLSFGELDVRCGFVRLDIERSPDGVRLDARHIHIDPQPMRREVVRAGDLPADDPTAWLVARIRAVSAPDQILQLKLDGPLPRAAYQALRVREAWEVGNDLNFYFDLDRRGLTVEAEAGEVRGAGERVSARGELASVADQLRAAAEDPAERALLEEARALVLARYGSAGLAD